MDKQLSVLRLLHIAFFALIPMGVFIIFSMPVLDISPVFSSTDFTLYIIEVSLAFIAIVDLLLGCYWFKITRKMMSISNPEAVVVTNHILRICLFEAIAIYGLVLGILGSSWYIWLPFFALSLIALTLTFPTSERWANWTQNRSTP